jgi:hypothetical protein
MYVCNFTSWTTASKNFAKGGKESFDLPNNHETIFHPKSSDVELEEKTTTTTATASASANNTKINPPLPPRLLAPSAAQHEQQRFGFRGTCCPR